MIGVARKNLAAQWMAAGRAPALQRFEEGTARIGASLASGGQRDEADERNEQSRHSIAPQARPAALTSMDLRDLLNREFRPINP